MPTRLAVPHKPDPTTVAAKALLRAAELLDMSARDVSGVIGLSEASVSRLKHEGGTTRLAGKAYELALLFIRLYRSLDALMGGDDAKSRAWLHAHNDHLRGVPAERIRTVEGLVDVVQYLDAMRGRL